MDLFTNNWVLSVCYNHIVNNSKHQLPSPFWSIQEYKQIKKKLSLSLLFWFLNTLLGGAIGFLYLFDISFVVIGNLTLFNILKLSDFSIEAIAISSSFYLTILVLALTHFWLLFLVLKKDLIKTNMLAKNKYKFNILIALFWIFNWSLVLYHLVAINKYFFKKQKQEQFNKKHFSINNASRKIQDAAQESVQKLEEEKVLKSFNEKELNLDEINITNSKDWDGDSTKNLKSSFPEIIKTDDLNRVLKRISKKEKQLLRIKNAKAISPQYKSQQENQIKSSLNLNREILKTAMHLKDLQEQDSSSENPTRDPLQASLDAKLSSKKMNATKLNDENKNLQEKLPKDLSLVDLENNSNSQTTDNLKEVSKNQSFNLRSSQPPTTSNIQCSEPHDGIAFAKESKTHQCNDKQNYK